VEPNPKHLAAGPLPPTLVRFAAQALKGRGRIFCYSAPARTYPDAYAATPLPHRSQMNGFQRPRLWWGSRGQSPLAGFRAEP
jgi:hypothetical protein